MSKMRFLDKVVLITGGANGIGRAAAEAFAEEGAVVVIADVDDKCGTELSGSLQKATFVRTDVSLMDDARRAVETAEQTYGGLDVLVSNAGIQGYGLIENVTEEEYERLMGVNFKGHVWMCKYTVPALRRRGGGAIVCMSSVQALATQTQVPIYAASKAATLTLTKAIAMDHAHEGIRINTVLPGTVDTPMARHEAEKISPGDAEGLISTWGRQHPMGRVICPEDVAKIILFLSSDDAAMMTGAPYLIDGGLMARLPVDLRVLK